LYIKLENTRPFRSQWGMSTAVIWGEIDKSKRKMGKMCKKKKESWKITKKKGI
jgi:hypothetical protein